MEKASRSLLLERRGAVPFTVNLNLRYLVFPLFIAFIVSAPVMRGLFFPADLYPHLIALGGILLLTSVQVIMRKDEVFHGFMPLAFLWLAASYGLSCFAAASPPEAFRGFLRYLAYFGVFFVAAYLSRESRGRRALVLSVFAGATGVALIGLLSATKLFVFPGAASGGTIMSTLQYPNALAAYLMFSSVIGLTLLCVEENALVRGALAAATSVQALVFLSSYSRGGWVVYPIALALMFVGMPRVQRARLTFHACTTLTSVLIIVRRFTETIEGKAPGGAVKYVLFGLGIALFFEAAYALFARVSSAMLSPSAKRVLGWAGGVYAAATVSAYLLALASQYSLGMAGMISSSMLRAFRSIRVDDPSLLIRAFTTEDALKLFVRRPFLGGGAGAWDALYHGVQRVLYWTTEVHNHFAQILVEAGILGFAAYLAVWGGLAFCVVKLMIAARRRGQMQDSVEIALTWGLASACLAMGVHSAMDFELSLPGIAVQLWAVFGVVFESSRDAAFLSSSRSRRVVPEAKETGRLNGVVAGSLVALLSLVLIISSSCLKRGAWYGSLGAAALMRQDFYTAIQLYEQAEKFDPLTASYSLDEGQAYAAMALLEGREGARVDALSQLERARRQEPFKVSHRLREVETLTSLGEVGKALEVSREVVAMLPLDVQVYETFAKLCVVSYMTKTGRPPGTPDPLAEVTGIPERIEALQAAVTGAYRERWNPAKLSPTPSLNMYIGQAYYLGGDLERAMAFFAKSLGGKVKLPEAQAWMTASRILAGQVPAANVSNEVLQVLSYFHPAAR